MQLIRFNTLTTCPYCGCGCGLRLEVDNDKVVGSFPSCNHPVSRGALCAKGWNCYEFIHSPARLVQPLIKKQGRFHAVSWGAALDYTASKLCAISKRYGRDSLAFLSSAKATNEENYLLMKLALGVFGTNNIDHCARLCHSSTVVGLKAAFGSGAMTNSIAEFEDARLILVTGSDTTGQHPLIASRIINSVLDRGAKLIVVDPRRIELAKYADIYLSPRCGSDVCWINGLMHIIIKEGLHDRAFIRRRCQGFGRLKQGVAKYNPQYVEKITGIPGDKLVKAARLYARTKKAMIVYAMGITQHTTGVDNVASLANLSMLCGHIGYECSGVNPLRGQNNVQGACDLGALPNVFSGYQPVGDEAVCSKFARAWGADNLPSKPGKTVTEMFSACLSGEVRGLYIMGENPALSDPNTNHIRRALKKVGFLAVSELFLSETAEYADVVLPAASFAEKDGTFTSTERRIQRIRRAISPVGKSRPDWQIISRLGQRCGRGDMFSYSSPAEIMDEIASLTPIYVGVSYPRLEPHGLQWPVADRAHSGTKFLHRDKFTRGKGQFSFCEYKPPYELPDKEYPWTLTTGRVYWHWHTGTMTRRTSLLEREAPHPFVELNPADARELKVKAGQWVKVVSRRGVVCLKARVTDRVGRRLAFIPFHFREAAANLLTIDAVDPRAKIPEYKACAVKIVH
ncbi:MAG: formate dehydrogenase subunit alpha [Candidatus Omnitrophota bacterium]